MTSGGQTPTSTSSPCTGRAVCQTSWACSGRSQGESTQLSLRVRSPGPGDDRSPPSVQPSWGHCRGSQAGSGSCMSPGNTAVIWPLGEMAVISKKCGGALALWAGVQVSDEQSCPAREELRVPCSPSLLQKPQSDQRRRMGRVGF